MTIAVVVADGRSHTCLLTPVFIKSGTGCNRNVGESPVVIVSIQDRGGAVARNVDVWPAVFVEVERRNAEGIVTVGALDVRLARNIFEGSVAAIVVKNVLRSGKAARSAHHRNAFPE